MRPISADVALSVCVFVCLPVCVSVEHHREFCARMTDAIDVQFGAFTQVDPMNRGPDPLRGKRRIFSSGGDFPVH